MVWSRKLARRAAAVLVVLAVVLGFGLAATGLAGCAPKPPVAEENGDGTDAGAGAGTGGTTGGSTSGGTTAGATTTGGGTEADNIWRVACWKAGQHLAFDMSYVQYESTEGSFARPTPIRRTGKSAA